MRKIMTFAVIAVAASASMQVCGAEFASAPEAPFPMPEILVWRSTGRDFPLNDFGGDFNKAI